MRRDDQVYSSSSTSSLVHGGNSTQRLYSDKNLTGTRTRTQEERRSYLQLQGRRPC